MIDSILNFFSTSRRIQARNRDPRDMRQQLFGTTHTRQSHPLRAGYIGRADAADPTSPSRADATDSHPRCRACGCTHSYGCKGGRVCYGCKAIS